LRVGLKNDRVARWLWLACLLGVWDLGANVPSSNQDGKTLPPGCPWKLNRRPNKVTPASFMVDNLNQLTGGPTSPYYYDSDGNLAGQVNYYAYGYSCDDEDRLVSVVFTGISKSDRKKRPVPWPGHGTAVDATPAP
jgi:hypothetical protein